MIRAASATLLLALALPAFALPAGRIDGRVLQGKTPVARATVLIESYGAKAQERYRSEVQTDPEGRFTARGLPAGKYRVSRLVMFDQITAQGISPTGTGTHGVRAEVPEGGQVSVTIGGTGRSVTGRLVPGPSLAGRRLAFTAGDFRFLTLKDARDDGFPGRILVLSINEDGAFRCEDVPPGEYELLVTVKDAEGRLDARDIGHVSRKVIVPQGADAQPYDLGRIEVGAVPKQSGR